MSTLASLESLPSPEKAAPRASGWREMRLGDAVQITHGWPFVGDLCTEELSGKPIIVSIGNFRYTGGFRFGETMIREYRGDYPKEYELSPGEILLVMTCQTAGGEILGIPARIPDDGRTYLHNQRMGKVVVKQPDMVDEDFLYWLFLWSEFNRELFISATGTKILHTAPTRIEAFRFSCPPLPEQRAIAAVLGALDDKIELNRRMNETLEALAQTLFKSWFVDATQSALPKGWREGKLSDIADIVMGLSPDGDSYNTEGTGVPLINGPVEFGEYFPVKSKWTTSPTRMAQAGDLIFCVRGSTTGRRVVANDAYCLGRGVCGMRAKSGANAFLYQTVNLGLESLLAKTTGSVFPSLSAPDIKGFPIVLPPEEIMAQFSKNAQPLVERIQANVRESRTLAALRDALLPKLLSGELRVPTAAQFTEAIA